MTSEKTALATADEAGRAKDEFLAMLRHELRNPLAPIVTALHLMRLRGAGVLERERAVVERQVSHLMRLVDDLLDVSRAARGSLRLERTPIELSAVVADAIEAAEPLVEERKQRLTVSVPHAGFVIEADRAAACAGGHQPPQQCGEVHAVRRAHHGFRADRRGPRRARRRRRRRGHRARPLCRIVFEAFTQGRAGARSENRAVLGLARAPSRGSSSFPGTAGPSRRAAPGRGGDPDDRAPAARRPVLAKHRGLTRAGERNAAARCAPCARRRRQPRRGRALREGAQRGGPRGARRGRWPGARCSSSRHDRARHRLPRHRAAC